MTLVSILVPTRNRAEVLRHALATLTAVDDDRVEIIVSDNASIDGTRDVVEGIGDPRIRYINTGRSTGMTQNWELALSQARGDWIGFMGDDDGMLPDALARLRAIIEETKVRAVRGAFANYMWPSLAPDGRGRLFMPLGRDVVVTQSRHELDSVLAGRVRYTRLPVLYNGGFAARTLIDEARDLSGTFFRSRIPDVYSGMALANLTDRYAWSEIPFFLNGASKHSTGSAYSAQASGRTEAIAAFEREENLPFHSAVPLNRDGSLPRSLHALILESWFQFREVVPGTPDLSPEDQLQIMIAAMADPRSEETWIRDFAERHTISISEPLPSRRAVSDRWRSAWTGCGWTIGTPTCRRKRWTT